MDLPQCCYLAKGAKRPSHTTNTIKFDRIPFDPCNSIKRFDLCPFNQKKVDLFTATPLDGTQKNWTQPVFVKTAQELISRMDDKRSKVFNAHQGKFGSQWLNVAPCKNLGLKLDDQQLRISIGLRLGASIFVAPTCHCG